VGLQEEDEEEEGFGSGVELAEEVMWVMLTSMM